MIFRMSGKDYGRMKKEKGSSCANKNIKKNDRKTKPMR